MRKLFFLFIAMVFVPVIYAQKLPVIKASLDKTRILIGEPAQLTIETEAASASFIHIDSILHFEISGQPRIDTIKKDNSVVVKGVYIITSFDSGHWTIPSFRLNANVHTDTIPVDVVFSEFDPNQEYHSIKDIIETKSPVKKFPWWWIAAGAVLLLAILFYYLKNRKPAPKAIPLRRGLNAYDEAIQALDRLANDKLRGKAYYSSMTDILRVYIFKRKSILSLQKTTDDLVVQLAQVGLMKPQFEQLAQVLRLSDFVKFAKYQPAEEDDLVAIKTIRDSIRQIEEQHSQPKLKVD